MTRDDTPITPEQLLTAARAYVVGHLGAADPRASLRALKRENPLLHGIVCNLLKDSRP